jgi:hypothetical protein
MSVIGGAEGDRTPDLRIANAALCQTELLPHATKNTVSSFEFQVLRLRQFAQIALTATKQKACVQ